MQKILYVIPHCSTGGLPQYTLKQIEQFKEILKISVAEVNYYGEDFVVQRNQIKTLCDFHSLFGKEMNLIPLIERIKPDIIHFQELPEQFLSHDSCVKIFAEKRSYLIITTTHNSQANPGNILFEPDRFILVCQWSWVKFRKQFPHIDCGLWEYPIEKKQVNKKQARSILKWDKDKLNVLNVGLFTPGKNQNEIFELARTLPDVNFHFVGNQAGNFAHYWSPLMKNRPDNCFVYGERADVETFYQAADVFYFPSLSELNPICVREALSHRLPVLMRKLDVYMDQYDRNTLVTYIRTPDDAYKILNKIK